MPESAGSTTAAAAAAVPSARSYQLRISKECKNRNAIVVLPTGAGKTYIASLVIKDVVNANKAKKVVFLVPTCMLVKQQGAALQQHTGLVVGQYSGKDTFPACYDVLVSTPAAFLAKQLPWDMFSLVVFDEVHHVSKDHPYRMAALWLRTLDKSASPQILGLTALLTYAVRSNEIQDDMRTMTTELQIDHMATATKEELQEGGYHANAASTLIAREDLLGMSQVSSDPMIVPVADRKTHALLLEFLKRVEDGRNTVFTTLLLKVVRAMEAQACERDGDFTSPLLQGKLADWGAYAKKRATAAPICSELEHWYEALRFSAISWEEECELPVLYLKMALNASRETSLTRGDHLDYTPSKDDHEDRILTFVGNAHVQASVQEFNQYVAGNVTFPRLEYLEQTLLERKDKNLRAIVFVQQKITTHILSHFINTNTQLGKADLRATHLYATDSPATASYKMTRSESKKNIESFRLGTACVLVTTTVAEEGMDVPEANCVIRYDTMQTPVSYVQGRGRARQENSDFIVMKQFPGRSIHSLGAAEVHQHTLVRDFEPNHEADNLELQSKQILVERKARETLMRVGTVEQAMETLHTYKQKTKASVVPNECKNTLGQWQCTLTYISALRVVTGEGVHDQSPTKAKRAASYSLLAALRQLDAALT
jgi:ERCC4-related helicase